MVIFEQEVLDLMSTPQNDILDVGYGWGITSNYFYNQPNTLLIILNDNSTKTLDNIGRIHNLL